MAATIKTVERKRLSLAERTYLPQVIGGMWMTLRWIFKPKVTIEYPEERPPIPPGYRGAPALVKDPEGREKCVSCQLCEFVCPPKAIRITPGEIPADDRVVSASINRGVPLLLGDKSRPPAKNILDLLGAIKERLVERPREKEEAAEPARPRLRGR